MVTTHGDSFCYVIDALIWLEHFTATEIELKILLIIATLQTLSIQCVIKEQKKTTWWVAQVPTDRPTANYDSWWFFCITLHLFNMPNWRWFLAQQELTAHTIASLSLSNDRLMTSINWFNKKLNTQQNIILNLANISFMIKIVSQLYGTSFFTVTLAIWWKLLGWVTSDAFLKFSFIDTTHHSIQYGLSMFNIPCFYSFNRICNWKFKQ